VQELNFKNMKSLTKIAALVAIAIFSANVYAQKSITDKTVKIEVKGTPHDWVMISNSGTFTGTMGGNAIDNVKFTTGAESLKSTKKMMPGKMNSLAYEALKTDKHANITFTATSLPVGKSNVTGNLTIAGTTKSISLPVNVVKSGNTFTVTAGPKTVKMTDFGMKPPKYMGMGTGDEVTITVTVTTN
jgi:polyisoprenoid-binding protein YceI